MLKGSKGDSLLPSYLYVLSSSNQMYSGTGTVIFDWIRYARGQYRFSILMDSLHEINVEATIKFCRSYDVPLRLSSPSALPGCPDAGVKSIPSHLRAHTYDVIECVSWANAATNLAVLTARPESSRLVFTPHSQPIWTLRGSERYFMVSEVFRRMIEASDLIFLDSDSELQLPEFSGADRKRLHRVALGVDPETFRVATAPVLGQIACVCDCRESRKRVDRLVAAFEIAYQGNRDLRLVLAGRGSDEVAVPQHVAAGVQRRGYVPSEELVEIYRTSALFVLLSDYEAFGLPIAEALSCGTSVLLNRNSVMQELFADLPGVYWTDSQDSTQTAEAIGRLATHPLPPEHVACAARKRFALENTYGRKRDLLRTVLQAL